MADSSLLSNQNSLDTYPSFKNLPSIKDNQDAFTIDERDLVEQTNNSQAIDKPQENKQTKKTKSSNSPVLCDICSVWISSQIVYDIHIQGRKHQTQLKAIVLENPEYKTPTYDELSSRKQSNEIVNNSIKKTDSIVNKSIKLACDTCHVTCNSQQMFDTHIAGKRHQMKLREGIFPISDQSVHNHKSSFSNSKRQQKHFECQLCQKTFREQIHFNRHLNSASHRENTSKNYNPFLTSDNSNLYPSQTNTWTQSTYPDTQLNNPKRLRTYYNPDYSTSHEQISSNFSQDYRSWDYRYYNQSYCQYQSDPNSNPSIYHPSNQTQPLPDYIPVSSHYSY